MPSNVAALTTGRRVFDALFGIVLPTICLLADPLVFREFWPLRGSLLPVAWRVPVLALCLGGMISLVIFLLTAGRTGAWRLLLLPPLLVGAVVALGLAAAVLPMAMAGLFFLVGILGFVPIVTAFVYLRAFAGVLREQPDHSRLDGSLVGTALLVVVLATVLWTVERRRHLSEGDVLDRAVPELLGRDDAAVRVGLELVAGAEPDSVPYHCRSLYQRYWSLDPEDPGRGRLEAIYRETTGRDLPRDAERYQD